MEQENELSLFRSFSKNECATMCLITLLKIEEMIDKQLSDCPTLGQ